MCVSVRMMYNVYYDNKNRSKSDNYVKQVGSTDLENR